MTKNDFMQYLEYLNKLFKIDIPDKEALPAWYKPFEKVNLHTAKKMADMYFQEEKGYFKLAKLIEYKSKAATTGNYNNLPKDSQQKCFFCADTGVIQVEIPYKKSYTIVCRACLCSIGREQPAYIRRIKEEELKNIDKNGKIIRDLSLHHTEDEEETGRTNLDEYFERMKGRAIV